MKSIGFIIIILSTACIEGYSQNGYGLKDLIALAEKNYPSIAAKKSQALAAAKGIAIQKNTIVPSFDATYQADYATYNNITGMAYPQYLVPISGPPSTTNNYNAVMGSAASLLLNWQPITFGQRTAQINVASQNYQLTLADQNNTLFQIKLNVVSTWLNILYADELIKVYSENIIRIQTQLKQISSLVKSGIRPGADTSLFQAELSKGNIDLYNLQLYRTQQQNNLSELTGGIRIAVVTDSSLAHQLPVFNLEDSMVTHPFIQYGLQLIQLQRANKAVIQKNKLPKLNVWSTAYARGSGIKYDGSVKSTDGLGLSRFNYGFGLQLSVPILQFTYTRLQVQQQDALISSYHSLLQQTQLQLTTDSLNASEALRSSLQVVNEVPAQLSAATVAYRSTLSRYNAGLASFADLIQSQYALVQAETYVRQSYLNVWKAMLQQIAAKGNIELFLNQVR
jgi:outer membrane protein